MARLAAIPLRLDRRALTAFLLVVICSNSGNYGLPVTLLAFGREALTFASIYFVASSMFTYTGGVFLAASGKRSVRDALIGVATHPGRLRRCRGSRDDEPGDSPAGSGDVARSRFSATRRCR